MNKCVAILVKQTKEEEQNEDLKRRQRKNKDQTKILENEYLKNPNWTRKFMRDISRSLGLKECQVYKWHWD